MIKKQYFGLKYPFTSENMYGYYCDLNDNNLDKIRSMIMHVLFTPKGQRIRNPEFGTDLIQYIFEQSDENTWNKVKTSITDTVTKYIPNVSIKNIQVVKDENNDQSIFVRIDFQAKQGNQYVNDSFITKI